MEKVYKMNGYDLHLIPTNKFKNMQKELYFLLCLQRGQKSIRLPKSYQNTWRACMA